MTDSAGVASGVGSRFFSVFNAGSALTASAGSAMRPAGPDLGRRVEDIGGRTVAASVGVREGFGLSTPIRRPVARHRRRPARVDDGARSARDSARSDAPRRLPGSDGDYAGYLVVDGQLRELPVGSSFDPVRGAFYWQPGLGYVGNYDLLFVRTGADGARERIPVRVTLQDRPTTALASKLCRPVGERQLRSLRLFPYIADVSQPCAWLC